MHIKNPSILKKIQAAMNLLNDLIEEIKNHQDKSLFFQDPRVIEGWLLLAGEIKEIEIEETSESEEKWENRSEPLALSLLDRRDLFSNYKKLYHLYYDPLYSLWNNYIGMDWDCVSVDAKEALKAEQYLQGQKDVEDLDEYIVQLNNWSHDARYALYKTLTGVFDILQAIMNKARQVVIALNPSVEEFLKVIDDDLKYWTNGMGQLYLSEMKEELNRHYKAYRTAPYTPELWGELLGADEEALLMASKRELSRCDAINQKHWGEYMKKQMDKNYELMGLLHSSCRTEEIFDLRNVEFSEHIIDLLTDWNLPDFYDIIVRRTLIQCEMFPDLKTQHEKWLKGTEEQEDDTPAEELHNLKDMLNFNAPKINLQRLLQQSWFAELRSDEKYDSTWTDNFVEALMASEYGEEIARDWAVKGAREKKNQLKAYVVGILKDEGVLKGGYKEIAEKMGTSDEKRTFSTYMSRGKHQQYAEWVKEYVAE